MLSSVYAEILPELGYKVTWIVTHSNALTGSVKRYRWKNSDVISWPETDNNKGKFFSLADPLIRNLFSFKRSWSFCRSNSVSIIQIRNDIFSAILHSIVAKTFQCKLVYQISYPFPESLVEVQELRTGRRSRLRRAYASLLSRLRRLGMVWSDCILPISDEMARQFQKQGIPINKMMPFPLGTNCPSMPTQEDVQKVRQSLTFLNQESPVILYFGVIDRVRQLDFVLQVARIVHKRHSSARWIFLGSGPVGELHRLKMFRDELGLEDVVHFVGRVPREQVNIYLRLSVLSVSPIPLTETFLVSSPTKAVESLALACPVVGTPIPDQMELLIKSGGGLIAPFIPDRFAEAILYLLESKDKAISMGEDGQRYVRQYRSYQTLAKKIDAQYQLLLEPSNA